MEQKFTFLDETTLPYGPMEYITRQTQGDFAVLTRKPVMASDPAVAANPRARSAKLRAAERVR